MASPAPILKSAKEIEAMRRGGRILALVLEFLKTELEAGMTTLEVSKLAVAELKRLGGRPAFLGYRGFPAPICVSVNAQVVHGIPSQYRLKAGDLVGLDLGVLYRGLITDGAITVPVGQPSAEAQKLLRLTESALEAGLNQARAGNTVGDISSAIEQTLTKGGLSVVQNLSGHGVGREVHEEPEVPNQGKAGRGPVLKAGMTLAIEPMASRGSGEIEIEPDGWTVATADGSLSAQFEHTVLIREGDAEILTKL